MLQFPGTYSETMSLGFEGGAGDAAPKACTTGVNETEAMPFGRAVAFDPTGTIDRSVKLTDAAGDELFGVTFHSHFNESFDPALTGVAQVSTVTVAAVAIADGDTWIISLFLPGVDDPFVFTIVRAGAVPVDVNAVATQFRTDINADPAVGNFLTAGGAGADVVLTADTARAFGVLTAIVDGGGTPTLVHALTTSGEPDGVLVNDPANIMRQGSIWVRTEDAVTPASGVFVRITANAGVGTALGAFRGTADGGNTVDISTVARWATSSQGGGDNTLAKLIVNLPHV